MKRQSELLSPLAVALCATMLPACPAGYSFPPEMQMVKITGGTMRLGSDDLLCGPADDPEILRCDSGAQVDPLEWIEYLTWVPRAEATVGSFAIDVHEVSNLQYRYCVEHGECTRPVRSSVNNTQYYGNSNFDHYPVVYVNRSQAEQYCAFVGKTLPNEAQWERAARVTEDGTLLTYPWPGTEPSSCSPGSAHYAVTRGCSPMPLPVDYSEADRIDLGDGLGLRNMASNVSEWVIDDWNRYAYCEDVEGYPEECQTKGAECATCKSDDKSDDGIPCEESYESEFCPCAKSCRPDELVICKAGTYSFDAENPNSGDDRRAMIRGGSYLHGRCDLRLFLRHRPVEGDVAGPEIGFRCVKEGN